MQSQTCPFCGGELKAEILGGLCPRCVFKQTTTNDAQSAEPHPATHDDTPDTSEIRSPKSEIRTCFGDYELLEEIARGGMGVVYKARQKSLNRLVALKMMLSGQFAQPEFVQRFRAEAEAIAQLQHRNIVAIHEVGEHEGQPYFTMDFVAGRTLAEIVREGPLPAPQAASYLKAIAEAVHYAHQHGILHRDLKPSNVLIGANDQPRITDFGLAKKLTSDFGLRTSDLTLTGQVLGSPNYLSPEQAAGRQAEVGLVSDVYALGAMLYHLVSGRPPFQADSLTTLLRQVMETEPVSPQLLNASIPRDLETICLKCLEKEPSRRYASAQLLADELGRFLKGQPVLARPVGPTGKVWRWCRRRPALAGMGAALALTFVLGLAGVLWQWHQARNQRRVAQMGEYAADMKLAQQAVENNDLRLAVHYLEKHRPEAKSEVRSPKSEVDLRGWEWRHLWQRCQGDELVRLHQYPGPIRAVAVSKDGKRLAVQTAGNQAALWDLTTHQPITEFADAGLKALAFSPDDRLLAVAGHDARGGPTVDLWDLPAQKLSRALSHTSPVRSLAFSPDGSLLATFDDQGKVAVVEWNSGRIHTNLMAGPPRRGAAGVVAFSPDGNRLAVGEDYGTIRLVKWPSGSPLPIETQTTDGVTALAFSPDSKILAAGFVYHSGTIRLWDADSGQAQGQLTNAGSVISLAFSPDGERLAAASYGEPIRIWNVATQAELGRLRGDVDTLGGVAFLPDGRRLVSGSTEGWVYIWDSAAGSRHSEAAKLVVSPDSVTLPPPVVNRFGIAFTPDSQSFITTDPEGSLAIWSFQPLRQIESLSPLGTNNWAVGLSPDGHLLATGKTSGQIHVWDWQVRRRVASLEVPFEWAGYLRFSRSSQFLSARVFFNDDTAKVRMWRTDDWQEVPLATAQQAGIMSVDLSPDDRHLAAGYADGTVKLWSFPAGQLEATYTHRNGWVFGVCFSEDGRMLASAGVDGFVIWDVVARRESVSWRGLTGPVRSVAFSPDGRRLATGGGDATEAVKLWDLATHRELLTLAAEGFFFSDLAFSPDGNTLVASSLSGIAHFWHAPSWWEIKATEEGSTPP